MLSTRAPHSSPRRGARQRGMGIIGLLFWAAVLGILLVCGMRVFPTITEYAAIKRAVDKVAKAGAGETPQSIRAAYERQRQIEYGIEAVSGQDLQITKVNDKVTVSFAYEKEVPLLGAVSLLIRYDGSASSGK